MTNRVKLLVLLFFSTLFLSCNYHTYLNNAVNVSFFEEEKDVQLTGMVNTQKLQLQSSFAYSSKNFLFANGYVRYEDHWLVNGYNEAALIEGGFGYFKKSNDLYFETLGGIGYAHCKGNHSRKISAMMGGIDTVKYLTSYMKIYNQFFFGKNTSGNFNVGFGLRSNVVYYPAYNHEYLVDDYGLQTTIDEDIRRKNIVGVVIDPFIHIESKKRLRVTGTIGYSFSFYNKLNNNSFDFSQKDYNSSSSDMHPLFNSLILNFGIKYIFGKPRNNAPY